MLKTTRVSCMVKKRRREGERSVFLHGWLNDGWFFGRLFSALRFGLLFVWFIRCVERIVCSARREYWSADSRLEYFLMRSCSLYKWRNWDTWKGKPTEHPSLKLLLAMIGAFIALVFIPFRFIFPLIGTQVAALWLLILCFRSFGLLHYKVPRQRIVHGSLA